MTSRFKRLFMIFAPFHALLTGVAQRDMARRSREQVRGPKVLWKALVWWNPFASIAYWVLGRRRMAPGAGDGAAGDNGLIDANSYDRSAGG